MKLKFMVLICISILALMTKAQKVNNKIEKIVIAGNCEQCKHRIENALKTKGIYKAIWNIETNVLNISFDSTKFSTQKIQQILANAGHDSKGFYTTDNIYNHLPECCKYERLKKDSTTITLSNSVIPIAPTTIVDTVKTNTMPSLKDTTTKTQQLNEVQVESKRFSAFLANSVATNTLTLTNKELTKAACCNLSESFETSPGVDVSYSDAVLGIKQIQLLGLSGNYTQLTTENVPDIRGLIGSYGLTFVPGSYVESVQVTKGTGSVANGFESIAGQINIEEKKATTNEKLFANSYINNLGRMEGSVNFSTAINDKLHTTLLLHTNGVATKNDENKDGYLDIPLGYQRNVISRWLYENKKGFETQFIVKALKDKRIAGEVNFDENKDKLSTNKYGVGIGVDQVVLTSKIGYVFPKTSYKSIGLILSYNNYNNNSYYGINAYNAEQRSLYANLIYQSILGTTTHKYRIGASFMNDDYYETFAINNFKRKEIIAGIFAEYTYKPNDKLIAIAGIRVDNHNEYGSLITPRANLKYSFNTNTSIRISAGSGWRTTNIFAENTGLFISSRQYSILNKSSNYAYGLQPEKAWNFGINLYHKFKINNQSGTISIDAYRTFFNNQVAVDIDANPQSILFYNVRNKSFSNSLQAEINYELIKKLDMRLAYRFLNVQNNYNGTMLQKPLSAQHRAFINAAYQTSSNWLFDCTLQWIGEKRLPTTNTNPADKQMMSYSPNYFQLAAQVTKQFAKKWDIYIGVENATNALQNILILDGANPFGKYFDASMIWGNVNGRIFYLGAKFKLLK